jgi:hypothetical protein
VIVTGPFAEAATHDASVDAVDAEAGAPVGPGDVTVADDGPCVPG